MAQIHSLFGLWSWGLAQWFFQNRASRKISPENRWQHATAVTALRAVLSIGFLKFFWRPFMSSFLSLRPSWFVFCAFSLNGPRFESWAGKGARHSPNATTKRSKGIPQCLSFLYIVTRGFSPALAQAPDRLNRRFGE